MKQIKLHQREHRRRLGWRCLSKIVLFLCLWLHHPALAVEQSQRVQYDLRECRDRAIANHPIAKSGRILEEDANLALRLKKSEGNVEVNLRSDIGYYNGEPFGPSAVITGMSEEGVKQENKSGSYYFTKINGVLPLYKEGTLFNMPSSAVRGAQFGVGQAQWNKQTVYRTVTEAVINEYIRVLKETKSVENLEKILALAAGDYTLAKAKFKQNLISKNDLLIAEIKLTRAETKLSASRISREYSMKNLALLMGEEEHDGFEIMDLSDISVQVPQFEALSESVKQSHPEIKAQKYRIQMSEEAVKNALSKRYPTVTASVDYGIGNDFKGSASDQFMAYLKMELPLFDSGVRKKRTAYYRNRVLVEKNRLLEIKLSIAQDLEGIYLSLLSSEEEIKLLDKQVEQAQEALKLDKSKFGQSLISCTAVNKTETQLLQLLLNQTHAIYDRTFIELVLDALYLTMDPLKDNGIDIPDNGSARSNLAVRTTKTTQSNHHGSQK